MFSSMRGVTRRRPQLQIWRDSKRRTRPYGRRRLCGALIFMRLLARTAGLAAPAPRQEWYYFHAKALKVNGLCSAQLARYFIESLFLQEGHLALSGRGPVQQQLRQLQQRRSQPVIPSRRSVMDPTGSAAPESEYATVPGSDRCIITFALGP